MSPICQNTLGVLIETGPSQQVMTTGASGMAGTSSDSISLQAMVNEPPRGPDFGIADSSPRPDDSKEAWLFLAGESTPPTHPVSTTAIQALAHISIEGSCAFEALVWGFAFTFGL